MEETTIKKEPASQQIRQLAAIMFTDLTGYTAMMQEDEQKARVLRDKQRKALEKTYPDLLRKIASILW